MPQLESIKSRRQPDIYVVLLIISAVFIFFALALTYHELSEDYDFMGSAEGVVAEEDEFPEPEPEPEPDVGE